MRKLSIEQALQWAYRDQMVHVARPEGMPAEAVRSYSPGAATMEFGGEMIDSSTHVDFCAAPDAYTIHRAVMALRPVARVRSTDEIDMRYARGLMRLDFDAEARRASGNAVRPDVIEIVHVKNLVFHHAFRRDRPDAMLEPVDKYERGRRVFTHTSRKWGYNTLRYIGDDPLDVIIARAHYSLWRQAISDLRERIIDRLSAHTLTAELPFALETDGT